MKKKVLFVITARPSYSRVKSILTHLHNNKNVTVKVVTSASANDDKYGNVAKRIAEDGFDIETKCHTLIEGSPLAMVKTTGLSLIELGTVFYNSNPDLVVCIADRYETVATSLAAAYQNIPVMHLQGGEKTGSIDDKTRDCNTTLADYHLVCTENSKKRVEEIIGDSRNLYNIGCPSLDLAKDVLVNPLSKKTALSHVKGVGDPIDYSRPYLVVLLHPVTDVSENYENCKLLLKIINSTQIQTIWLWPNPDQGTDETSKAIRQFRENTSVNNIKFIKNLPPNIFLNLCMHSDCLVGNSSVAIRECSFLGIGCVNIGTRQKNRERASNVFDVDWNGQNIYDAIGTQRAVNITRSCLYGDGNSGRKAAVLIENILNNL